MTESHRAEPPRPMWAVEPEAVYERQVTPPPKRRRRWLRELPYVVIAVIVVGTIVTCGITQIFGDDELVEPGTAAGGDCFNLGPYAGVPGHAGLPEDMRDAVHPVSCGAPHTFETYRRGRFIRSSRGTHTPTPPPWTPSWTGCVCRS